MSGPDSSIPVQQPSTNVLIDVEKRNTAAGDVYLQRVRLADNIAEAQLALLEGIYLQLKTIRLILEDGFDTHISDDDAN